MTMQRVCMWDDGTERECFEKVPGEVLHLHERYELGFAPGQGFRLRAAGEEHTISPGSAYLVGPGLPHQVEPLEDAPPASGGFRRLYLGSLAVRQLQPDCSEKALQAPVWVPAHRAEALWNAPVWPSLSGAIHGQRIRRTRHPAVNRAMQHLQANLHRSVSLDELSKVCSLSKYHLCRIFHEKLGVTPRTYHRHIRVERGRALLRAGRPASQVASDLNFADQSHFIRSFRRQFGATPGLYLQAIRQRRLTPDASAETSGA